MGLRGQWGAGEWEGEGRGKGGRWGVLERGKGGERGERRFQSDGFERPKRSRREIGEDRGKGGVRACGVGKRRGEGEGRGQEKRKCIYSKKHLVILSKMM